MSRCVVAGIDGSRASLSAAEWAAQEAAARGLPLRLVHAEPLSPHLLPTVHGREEWRRGAALMVEAAVSDIARRHPGLETESRRVTDTAVDALAEAGRSAELLVVGTRGAGGFNGLRLGSVALGVAGGAPCPVALVPAYRPDQAPVPEVVLGIDARHPDVGAADFAFDAAQRREARLRAVFAWSLPAPFAAPWVPYAAPEEDRAAWEDLEVQLLDDALRGWREKYPSVPVLADVRLFGPAEALVRVSEGADLLVVGRGAGPGPYPSGVAHAVAHHAPCPVVLLPRA